MSRYKYWWRPNLERALREYPDMKARKADLQAATLTPNYSPMPSGNAPSRQTETLAMRQLPPEEEKWISAIDKAIDEIQRQHDGEAVIALVTAIYFKKTYTLNGAAYLYHMSESTAKRRLGRFIAIVAKHKGLL